MMKLATSILLVFSLLSSVSYATDKIILINSETDKPIEDLGSTVDYKLINTSKLNLEAKFQSHSSKSSHSVKSVRVTFDNPKRSFCDEKEPYSVFGDTDGDFYDATIPLGTHTVTATPYKESGCQKPAGTKLSKTFKVKGCGLSFNIYNAKTNSLSGELEDGDEVTLPCKVNMEAVVQCGFNVEEVRLELRNKDTGDAVKRTEYEEPYYLFGNHGSIAKGSYRMTVWIDGIKHPSLDFKVTSVAKCRSGKTRD
jgi:hypothetical protein